MPRETASRRNAACRNTRRSPASRRSQCPRRAAKSAAGFADFLSSTRCSAPSPPPPCAPSRSDPPRCIHGPRSSPCARMASAATSAAACPSLRSLVPQAWHQSRRAQSHDTSPHSSWPVPVADATHRKNRGDGMPIDKRVSFADALEGVSDGATVFITGFGGAGFPNKLIRALRDRGPRNMTLVVNSATHRYSLTHELIAADLVRKVICTAARGHDKEPSAFETRWMAGKIELEMVPQGTFTERIRAGGAGIPAFYTPVGFGTELTRGKEVRRFGDRDYVMEEAISGDLALIRADAADRTGNLSFNYAQMNFGPVMASAAKLAVAEVRTISDEPLARERIQLPGIYVDRVVAV